MIYTRKELERWLKIYEQSDLKVVPTLPLEKRPAIRKFLERCSSDFKVNIELFTGRFSGHGIGLCCRPSGVVAIDVDLKHGGLERWNMLISKHGDPKTLKATSGSGGRHYVFKAKAGQAYTGKIGSKDEKGIDVRHNHIIVVEPSYHYHAKAQYKWDQEPKRDIIADVPSWIAELIEKTPNSPSRTYEHLTASTMACLVEEAQKFEYSYDEWTSIGMAIHSALPGPDGLELFKQATLNESFSDGDLEKASEKWKSFSQKGGVGVGSFIHLLRDKGADLRKFYLENDRAQFADIISVPAQGLPGATIEGTHIVFKNSDLLVKGINSLGFFHLAETPGASLGKVSIDLETHEKSAITFGERRLKIDLAPIKLEFMKDGKTKLCAADQIWLGHRNRQSYTKIRSTPNQCRSDELNLWTPPALAPQIGDASAVVSMIKDSICAGNLDLFNFLMDFLAHIVQYPGSKVSTVPVLYSSLQGTGKGVLCNILMAKILGNRYYSMADASELTDRFNSSQANKLLTFVDEVSDQEGRRALAKIKALSGSPTMNVEHKGGAKFTIDNFSRYVLATNSASPIPIQRGNRRFVFIESSEKLANANGFFRPIINEIQNGSLANYFLRYLLDRRLADFEPNALPSQVGVGVEARLAHFGSVGEFWYQLFFEKPQTVFRKDVGLSLSSDAYSVYCEFTGPGRRDTSHKFTVVSKELLGLNGATTKQIRIRVGNQEKIRVYETTPSLCLGALCQVINVQPPSDFNEDALYFDSSDPMAATRIDPNDVELGEGAH